MRHSAGAQEKQRGGDDEGRGWSGDDVLGIGASVGSGIEVPGGIAAITLVNWWGVVGSGEVE